MTTLIMTRHGHVPGISPARFRGRVEVDLSPTGEAQAAALAARIAARWQPAAIYTSPLGRCVATGARIAAATACPSAIHDALADIDYGGWQWKTHGEAEAEAPELFAQWHATPQRVRFPGGESLQDVMVRAADLLRDLLARHQGDTVVLVGHDSSNRVLLAHLLDMPLSLYWRLGQEPCNLTVVEVSGEQAKLLRLNETAHLDGIAAP